MMEESRSSVTPGVTPARGIEPNKPAMRDSRWLFFDLGNTQISEETAWESRIQQLVCSLKRYSRRRSVEDVRSAFREASTEFAPRLVTRVIEKLSDDPEHHKLILAEARYPKELETPYEGVDQTIRALSSRYHIGVITNQPVGTAGRLMKWGLMPFISICPLLRRGGPRKTGSGDFRVRSFPGRLCTAASCNDRRPA